MRDLKSKISSVFEQIKPKVGIETQKMLNRLEGRVDRGTLKQQEAENTIKAVNEAIVRGKMMIDKIDLAKKTPEEIAQWTNAWHAWENRSDLAGWRGKDLNAKLENLIQQADGGLPRFARQIWRTEMTRYVIEKVRQSKRTDVPHVAETILASQIVGEKENDPIEALTGAMWLDPALRSRAFREGMAKKMEASGKGGDLKAIAEQFEGRIVQEVKVVVGGEFLSIPLKMAEAFVFKKMVKADNRIYAQMENGCQGNLVILELVKTEKTSPSAKGKEPTPARTPVAQTEPLPPVTTEPPRPALVLAPVAEPEPTLVVASAPEKAQPTAQVIPVEKIPSTPVVIPTLTPVVKPAQASTPASAPASTQASTQASAQASTPRSEPSAAPAPATPATSVEKTPPTPESTLVVASTPTLVEAPAEATVLAPVVVATTTESATTATISTKSNEPQPSSVPTHTSAPASTPPPAPALTPASAQASASAAPPAPVVKPTSAPTPAPTTKPVEAVKSTPAPVVTIPEPVVVARASASAPVLVVPEPAPAPSHTSTKAPTEPHEEPSKPPESPTSKQKESFTDIPEVTPECIEAAKKAMTDAYVYIRDTLKPQLQRAQDGSYDKKSGLAMVNDFLSKPLNVNDYLPLMVKESQLNPKKISHSDAKGLFQIKKDAIAEIKKYYGYTPTDLFNPTQNSVVGMLYLHRCLNHYTPKLEGYDRLSEQDRISLSHAMFNKGPGLVTRLWNELDTTSYADFEQTISIALAKQLDSTFDATKKPLLSTQKDEIYHITYQEPIGVSYYLKYYGKPHLAPTLMVNGKPTELTLGKAGEMLRYVRLIEGIDSALPKRAEVTSITEPASTSGKSEEKAPKKAPATPGELKTEQYTIKPGDKSLWRIGRRYGVSVLFLRKLNHLPTSDLHVGQTLQVPSREYKKEANAYFYPKISTEGLPWIEAMEGKGFWSTVVMNETYRDYLAKEIELPSDEVQEVIVDFNRRYNPELVDLADDAGNIPVGAQIWIPNVQYFLDYYAGKVDQPVGVAPREPEPPEVKESKLESTLTEPPEVTATIGEGMDKTTRGQYVKIVGGRWVRDTDAMKKGMERFATKTYENHPTWDVSHRQNRTLCGGRLELQDVRFIVLHSTGSETSARSVKDHVSHFVVERDGTIRNLVPVDKTTKGKYKIAPHAGKSMWNGVENLNEHAIGIEVVAKPGVAWSEAQYRTVRELTGWIGGYYGLQKRDVVTHQQVAYSRYGRGRKQDPYESGSILFQKLELPDNSRLLDLDVASNRVQPNLGALQRERETVWGGLNAGAALETQTVSKNPPKMDATALNAWKREIEKTCTITSHTVVRGETLYGLAKANGITVEILMAYNGLDDTTLSVGQVLKIPRPKIGETPRATTTGSPMESSEGTVDHPFIDSHMTREQALKGLKDKSWEHQKQQKAVEKMMENQELVDVKYYSFDGKIHQGQVLVDKRLAKDIREIFAVILKEKFPIRSVVPLADSKFNWTDSASMKANNSSGFNYRSSGVDGLIAGRTLSKHAYGFAIDLNPFQNPFYMSDGRVVPEGAKYDPSQLGTLTRNHPVAQAFISRDWDWGGDWNSSKDYQHFQKVL